MLKFYQCFQEECRGKQLFIHMKYTAALIYAANDKTGSYCGFFKEIPKRGRFDYREFLAAHALPGPGSRIDCII